MLGLGVFQLWMVPSTPPLKHCSPLALIVTQRTAPLQQKDTLSTSRNIWTGTRTTRSFGGFSGERLTCEL